MERDLVEEHRRQQEDEEFRREQQELAASNQGTAPRATQMPPSDAPRNDAPPLRRPATNSPVNSQGLVSDRSPMPKGVGVAVAVVLAMIALGWFGFRHFMPSSPTKMASALPGPELSAVAPVSLAAPTMPATLPSEAMAQPAAPMQDALAEEMTARQSGDAALAEQLSALNVRLDAMERRMGEVIGGLKAKGYLTADAELDGPLRPEDFVSHPGSARRPLSTASARPAASGVHSAARRITNKPKSTTAPVLEQQLLSVDLWNGRPSVVIGNGNPSSPQVRVLEPGDAINGVTLRAVDVTSGRATFVNEQNETVTLKVAGHP